MAQTSRGRKQDRKVDSITKCVTKPRKSRVKQAIEKVGNSRRKVEQELE
jgi:Protein of unknown function (DUF3606)